MISEEILRKIAALPPEGQRLIEDFVAFLEKRYESAGSAKKPGSLMDEPFIGMWRDRGDLEESSAWVRRVREFEWRP